MVGCRGFPSKSTCVVNLYDKLLWMFADCIQRINARILRKGTEDMGEKKGRACRENRYGMDGVEEVRLGRALIIAGRAQISMGRKRGRIIHGISFPFPISLRPQS